MKWPFARLAIWRPGSELRRLVWFFTRPHGLFTSYAALRTDWGSEEFGERLDDLSVALATGSMICVVLRGNEIPPHKSWLIMLADQCLRVLGLAMSRPYATHTDARGSFLSRVGSWEVTAPFACRVLSAPAGGMQRFVDGILFMSTRLETECIPTGAVFTIHHARENIIGISLKSGEYLSREEVLRIIGAS